MAPQFKIFYSGAGDDEAAARNYLSRKNFNPPISHYASTTPAAVCKLSPSQTHRITQPYGHSLIARVVGKDICRWKLARCLHRHLRLTEAVKVFDLGLGYFVLQFSEADYLALEDHPWPIPNLCISAIKWIPNFKPSEAPISVVDAWIRLHKLAIEYYDDEILRQIAETIGSALVKIDPVTKDRWKCKYARICVRIHLCDSLPSWIIIGETRQEIEYEGFDLCPHCRRVVDLKHVCLRNPSGSSSFDPHFCRPSSFQAIGSSSSSKQALISNTERSVAWGSTPESESKAPLLDLNDWPYLRVRGSERATTRTTTNSRQPQLLGLVAEPIENQKEICGVSVKAASTTIEVPVELEQKNLIPSIALNDHPMSISSNSEADSATTTTPELEQNNLFPSIALNGHSMSISSYPVGTLETITAPPELERKTLIPSMALNDHSMSISSCPEAAASTTITASAELEQNNLNLSMDLAPFVVEDQLRAAETSHSTTLAVHHNQPQPIPSSSTANIPSQQPSPTPKVVLTFCSNGIERSIIKKEITSSSSKGIGINRRPILYTLDPSHITSFAIGLSETPHAIPKQNQFVINIVSTSRSGNENGIGYSEAISASNSKTMLGWNFPGIDNGNLIEGLKYMVQKYETSIVVIFGSRISDVVVDQAVEELAFGGTYCKKSDDENGGVWLLMFREDVKTEVFEGDSYSTQQESASAYWHSETNEPLLGFSYADIETSSETWGPTSLCASIYSMPNALAY